MNHYQHSFNPLIWGKLLTIKKESLYTQSNRHILSESASVTSTLTRGKMKHIFTLSDGSVEIHTQHIFEDSSLEDEIIGKGFLIQDKSKGVTAFRTRYILKAKAEMI